MQKYNLCYSFCAALEEALDKAVMCVRSGDVIDPSVAHDRVKSMYTWMNVCKRTEKVLFIPRFLIKIHILFDTM